MVNQIQAQPDVAIVRYDPDRDQKEEPQCGICFEGEKVRFTCLETFNPYSLVCHSSRDPDVNGTRRKVNHLFHRTCLLEWIDSRRISNPNGICPMCRDPFTGESIGQELEPHLKLITPIQCLVIDPIKYVFEGILCGFYALAVSKGLVGNPIDLNRDIPCFVAPTIHAALWLSIRSSLRKAFDELGPRPPTIPLRERLEIALHALSTGSMFYISYCVNASIWGGESSKIGFHPDLIPMALTVGELLPPLYRTVNLGLHREDWVSLRLESIKSTFDEWIKKVIPLLTIICIAFRVLYSFYTD